MSSDSEESYSDDGDLNKYWEHIRKQKLKRAKAELEELLNFYQDETTKYEEQCFKKHQREKKWTEFLKNHYKKYAKEHEYGTPWKDEQKYGREFKQSANGSNSSQDAKQETPTIPPRTPQQILAKHNISNRKEWRIWLLKNHPDKSADPNATAYTKEVLIAGKDMNW
jgi:hypothetical protein